jgi:hypothetical protein
MGCDESKDVTRQEDLTTQTSIDLNLFDNEPFWVEYTKANLVAVRSFKRYADNCSKAYADLHANLEAYQLQATCKRHSSAAACMVSSPLEKPVRSQNSVDGAILESKAKVQRLSEVSGELWGLVQEVKAKLIELEEHKQQ